MQSILEYRDIYLQYNTKEFFNGLSCIVPRGEKIVFRGRSGTGKTTLFHCLLGFVCPDRGTVVFNGVPVTAKTVWDVRRSVAYVSQDVPLGTGVVGDSISAFFGLKVFAHRKIAAEEIGSACRRFDLPEGTLRKDVGQLSGGERQRVALAIALMSDRRVFLLDEVTSALDDEMKKQIRDVFLDMPDATVLVISHDSLWHQDARVRVFDIEAKQWVR